MKNVEVNYKDDTLKNAEVVSKSDRDKGKSIDNSSDSGDMFFADDNPHCVIDMDMDLDDILNNMGFPRPLKRLSKIKDASATRKKLRSEDVSTENPVEVPISSFAPSTTTAQITKITSSPRYIEQEEERFLPTFSIQGEPLKLDATYEDFGVSPCLVRNTILPFDYSKAEKMNDVELFDFMCKGVQMASIGSFEFRNRIFQANKVANKAKIELAKYRKELKFANEKLNTQITKNSELEKRIDDLESLLDVERKSKEEAIKDANNVLEVKKKEYGDKVVAIMKYFQAKLDVLNVGADAGEATIGYEGTQDEEEEEVNEGEENTDVGKEDDPDAQNSGAKRVSCFMSL